MAGNESHRAHLEALVKSKQRGAGPLSAEEQLLGHRGWYASRMLPHRDRRGLKQFLTFRLADALPRHVREELARVDTESSEEEHRWSRTEAWLDRGCGDCELRNPAMASRVEEALRYQDGKRYQLLAWVIMPNHVHVLIEVGDTPLGQIVQSWKAHTGRWINKMRGKSGPFWQKDYFDTYIRTEEHRIRVIRYIEENPVRAGLVAKSQDWPFGSGRFKRENDVDPR